MSTQLTNAIFYASGQTLEMVTLSCAFAVTLGLPLGIFLFVSHRKPLLGRPNLYRILSGVVNAMRSIPFIILMVAIIPFTRWVIGSSIGTAAAIVPLSLSAIPFFARLTESSMEEIPNGLIETSQALGASLFQTIRYVLIPEALASLVRGITLTAVTLVGYSAMAGVIGGGGLGDLAIRYGYQRFEFKVMLITVLILIAMVQVIQHLGDALAQWISHHK